MDNKLFNKNEIAKISDEFIEANYKELAKEIREENEKIKHSLERIQSEVFDEIEKLSITSEEDLKKHIKEIIPIKYWEKLKKLKISPLKAEKLLGGFPKNITINTRENMQIYIFNISQDITKRGRKKKIILKNKSPKKQKKHTLQTLETNYNTISNLIHDIRLLGLENSKTVESLKILEKYQYLVFEELKKRGKLTNKSLEVYDYTKPYEYKKKIKGIFNKINRLRKNPLLVAKRIESEIFEALKDIESIIKEI